MDGKKNDTFGKALGIIGTIIAVCTFLWGSGILRINKSENETTPPVHYNNQADYDNQADYNGAKSQENYPTIQVEGSIEDAESVTPCWLADLDMINRDCFYTHHESMISFKEGNDGKNYGHFLYAGSMYNGGSGEGWGEYYLDGKYSRLSGYLVIEKEFFDTRHSAQVTIYADGYIVYSSQTITSGDLPVYFDTDINNCSRLKIEFVGGDPFILGEVMLYP